MINKDFDRWKYLKKTREENSINPFTLYKNKEILGWFFYSLGRKIIKKKSRNYFNFSSKKKIKEIYILALKELDGITFNLNQKKILITNILNGYNSAYISLKAIETFFRNSDLIDYGSGSGIINYCYNLEKFKINSLINYDEITFSKESFEKLNNLNKNIYIFDNIKKLETYLNKKKSVVMFRWSYDEMSDESKMKILQRIIKSQVNGIMIQDSRRGLKSNTDIDVKLLNNQYNLIAYNYSYPLNHGQTRIYKKSKRDPSFKRKILINIFKILNMLPIKKILIEKIFFSIVSK
jgi:hypothetical protein